MANTIDWGKATQNNTNGYGKYQNTIGAASVYEDSWAGDTAIVGTSAAFTYAKSSYHQDESDPTPTITGTAGGTFSGTSGIVFVDSGTNSGSSTGQVDLSASTIQANTITYTVSGVSANFSLSVTASPFLANTYSMEFDGVGDYINCGVDLSSYTDMTVSTWVKWNSFTTGTYHYIFSAGTVAGGGRVFGIAKWENSGADANKLYTFDGATATKTSQVISLSTWYNVVVTQSGTTKKVYVNGVEISSFTAGALDLNNINYLGRYSYADTYYAPVNIDETAIWNTALSSDAITDIYNATNNNSGKALDLLTDSGNYTNSSSLQYWNRLGD